MNLRQRKTIRMKGHDYSLTGLYFITICVNDRSYLFGEIVDGKMELNRIGKIAEEHIQRITEHFCTVKIDAYCVMPNHVHMVIKIDSDLLRDNDVKKPLSTIPNTAIEIVQKKSKQLLPVIIQQYKASVSRDICIAGIWQRKYHDHIIRDEDSYLEIRRYIETNPLNWKNDMYYELEKLSQTKTD